MNQTLVDIELGRIAEVARRAAAAVPSVSVDVKVREKRGSDLAPEAIAALAQLCATAPATIDFLCEVVGIADVPPARTGRACRLQRMARQHRETARELVQFARWLDQCAHHIDSMEEVA